MRQAILALALISLCAFMYAACTENTTNSSLSNPAGKNHQHSLLSLDVTIPNLGTLHNQGLAQLRANYNHGADFATTYNQAAYILWLADQFFLTAGANIGSVNTSGNRDALVTMLNRRFPASDIDTWHAVKSQALFVNNTSHIDVAIIDEALKVFSLPTTGMTNAEIADRIINKADNLIPAWTSAGGGEASGGFLYIMKGSAAHWRDNPVRSTESPGTPPELGQLIQIDCVGYLVGWLSAIGIELSANGHLDVNNQYKRIGAGAATAISWSMGGPVRKYFGG